MYNTSKTYIKTCSLYILCLVAGWISFNKKQSVRWTQFLQKATTTSDYSVQKNYGCPFENVTRTAVSREEFQHIGNQCYVYSAYYDGRDAGTVRVVALTPGRLPTQPYCLLWYNTTQQPFLIKSRRRIWNNNSFRMRSAMFICDISAIRTLENMNIPPKFVSFTLEPCAPHSNGTLWVDNIHARNSTKQFIVCIHGPLQNYKDHLRLVEHVEAHKLFGADLYAIYNLSGSVVLNPYVDYYRERGELELHEWHIPPQHTHDAGQLALIHDCLYRYMYRANYIAMLDLDEFIVPRHHSTWQQMLNASRCAGRAQANFRNVFFRMYGPDNEGFTLRVNTTGTGSHRGDDNKGYLVTLSKTARGTDKPWQCRMRSKYIIRPEMVWYGTTHFVEKALQPLCCVETHLGLLHHYRELSPVERIYFETGNGEIDKTMHRFKDKLVSSVQKVIDLVKQNRSLN